uniref:Uncharacterized protein n=1 Tax=Rhizophora mucronata TaxID=61149 RepID=A0A2P2IHD9_RHIMU
MHRLGRSNNQMSVQSTNPISMLCLCCVVIIINVQLDLPKVTILRSPYYRTFISSQDTSPSLQLETDPHLFPQTKP